LMLCGVVCLAADQTVESTLSIKSESPSASEKGQVSVSVQLVNASSPKAALVLTTKKPKNILKLGTKDVQPIRSILTSIKTDDTKLQGLMQVVTFGGEAGIIKGYISNEQEENKYVVFYPGKSMFFFKLKEIDELIRLLEVLEASGK
jgi:hypothetical protein